MSLLPSSCFCWCHCLCGSPAPNPHLPQHFVNDHPPFTDISVTEIPQPLSLTLRSSPFMSHCFQIPNPFSRRNKDYFHVSVPFCWPSKSVPLLGTFVAPCPLALAIFSHYLAKSPSLHRRRWPAHFQLPSLEAEREKKTTATKFHISMSPELARSQ